MSLNPASPTRNNSQQARTSIEPAAAAAAAATAVSGVADNIHADTITVSDEHDIASQRIEQDSIVDQTRMWAT